MADIGEGLHPDIDFATYAAIPALNASTICKAFTKGGQISMKRLHAAVERRIKVDDSDDMRMGRALHCRTLEPERYGRDFLVSSPCCAILGSGNRKGARCGNTGRYFDGSNWFCGSHKQPDCNEPQDYISEEVAARIERCAEELRASPIMRRFASKGWSEVTAVWNHRGQLLKTRIDRLDEDHTTVIDLKKMPSGEGDRETCEKKTKDRRMHIQAAMNVMAVESLCGKTPDFIWTFQDDDEPYDVQVIPADDKTIRLGRFDVNQVVGMYAAAKASGDYRGYIYDPRVIRRGGLPSWYIAQCEQAGMLDSDLASSPGEQPASPEHAEF